MERQSGMTKEEAARILDLETTADALAEIEYEAEMHGPCSRCGYGGKHLDAPPCTTCPAHPKKAEKNEPLTLEELREMDGPVWVCYKQETWGPQAPASESMSCTHYKFSFQEYGKTWLAYRRKPEEAPADG